MDYRILGKTGLRVPNIGFGCGNVGGVMIRGTHEQQVSAVQHALSLGVDYFDTAAAYGNGQSETHLGEVLGELKPDVHVATKFRVTGDALKDLEGSIRRSLEESLTRLQRDSVDILQLHTNVFDNDDGQGLFIQHVLEKGGVADTLDALKAEKLIGNRGFTGMGDTAAIHRLIDSNRFDTVQTYYNLLNPTAGNVVPNTYPNQDYKQIIDNATAHHMGVIVIRSLAGGAVAGPTRAELASRMPGGEMATGNDYESDLRRAEALGFLAKGGRTVAQASVRFAVDNPNVSIVLVGFSDEAQMSDAVAAAASASITSAELETMKDLWASDFNA
jgi:L-galactose dehydrogenase/L-glyceraldehyde 3-phosphate reductase